MKLADDEKTAHSNAWRTHQETTESLKKSRGKLFSVTWPADNMTTNDRVGGDGVVALERRGANLDVEGVKQATL